MNRALFLDRDGVINEDYGYVHKIEDFHFREGIFDVCRAAQNARMKIIVVTNQAGIGRNLYTSSQFALLSEYMCLCFREKGIAITRVYHCPYHPDYGVGHFRMQSFDRKPRPGMIVKACNEENINPAHSIMIGDNESDHLACMAANVRWYQSAAEPLWDSRVISLICSF